MFQPEGVPCNLPENEKNRECIEKEIEDLFQEKLNLNIKEEYPFIFGRLVEMHMEKESHFDDAIEMMEMIEKMKTYGSESLKGVSKEKMMLAALVHDIGKSGPYEASVETRKIVRRFFGKTFDQSPAFRGVSVHSLTVKDFLERSDFDDRENIERVLTEELSIKIDEETMIEFWRRHVDWSWDILRNNKKGMIDDEITKVAASHHILDGKNPANLPEEEISEGAVFLGEFEGYQSLIHEYQFLTLIDKYQAFVERSHMTHDRAIDILRKIIGNHSFEKEETRKKYLDILEDISRSAKELKNAGLETQWVVGHRLG